MENIIFAYSFIICLCYFIYMGFLKIAYSFIFVNKYLLRSFLYVVTVSTGETPVTGMELQTNWETHIKQIIT